MVITIFGTITDDATKSGQALTVFQKKYSDIISDVKSSGLKKGLFGDNKLSLVDDGDINRVNEYFSLIDNGIDKNTALQSALSGASSAVKEIAVSSSSAAEAQQVMTGAVKEVTVAEKAATVGAKALSVGLNLLTNIGISIAINLAVNAITNFISASKEAEEAAKELRESGHNAIENFNEESKSLDSTIQKYVELYACTSDISTVKSELSDIQTELINKYGDEANGIDLVNGKLSEEIEKYRQIKREQAEAFVYDEKNRERYKQAVDSLNGTKNKKKVIPGEYTSVSLGDYTFSKEVGNAFHEAGINYQIGYNSHNESMILSIGGTLEKQKNTLNKMAEIYKSIDGYNEDIYNRLMQQYVEKKQLYEVDKEFADHYEQLESEIKTPDLIDETESQFFSLIEKAKELNQTIKGDGTATKRYAASQELKDLKNEIYELAGSSSELKNVADSTFSAFEAGASNATGSVVDLEKAFYESLEEKQKGSLKNIELIENAMQTLADGKYVSWDDFWDIKEIDTDDVIFLPESIGNEFKINMQQLQQLKDGYVKSEIESLQKENQTIREQIEGKNGVVNGLKDQLEYELMILDAQIAQGANSESDAQSIEAQRQKVQGIRDEMDAYEEQMERNVLLIKMWNSHIGDTTEIAEIYAKAMTTQIDSIIDKHESEKDALEKEKDLLNEQLDALEGQRQAIEDIIDDYKSVVDIVGDVTDKEIDLLRKQQEAEVNAVQAKIDAIKDAREQQEEENSLTEKQLALQEKLRDLEKARQAKVRTYSSERGWHFDVDKEAVANAQTAVDEARFDYDKAVDDKAYNDQISALEREKELISGNFDEQIKAYEDYCNEWKAIVDGQTRAENEQTAQQILGAEWREKIKNKDTDILNRFRSAFQGYNTQLNNLVNNEIANLNLSIKAKESEINAKADQIQAWSDYKTQVETSINDIKGKYEEYTGLLGQVELSEKSSYEERAKALADFIAKYEGYADDLQDVQSQLTEYAREAVSPMETSVIDVIRSTAEKMLPGIKFPPYANGGVVEHTGLAMLHGEKQRSEVVFNAAQSKRLYDMVAKGDFANLAAAKIAENWGSALKSIKSSRIVNNTSNSNSSSFLIQHMDVNGVQNPAEFANEFNRNMKQYLQNVRAESFVQ